MDTLISGNDNALAVMYLIYNRKDISIEKIKNSQQWKSFVIEGQKVLNAVIDSAVPLRPSFFNYAVATETKVLIYNTLYNAEAWLSIKEYAALQGKKKLAAEERRNFIEMGFIVPEDMEERENYARWRELMRKRRDHLSLNITTTLKCNAHCPYCYESGVKPVDFDEEKIEPLIAFIESKKKDPPLKLNWFGGEPLMNAQLIDKIIRRVGECGFQFESHIITNGSLITKKMLSKFKKWHVRSVQITLDGTEQRYAEKKAYPPSFKKPFAKILDHIEWVAEAGIHVDVRLNTDHENIEDMIDLIYLLQARFDGNNNVVYYPAFVTGTDSKLTEREKVDFIKRIFVSLANPQKLSITTRLYSSPRTSPCMKNDPRSFSVDVYGRVYGCEHLVGRPKESLGTLKRLPDKINKEREAENLREECQACVFLPKCMGGCASNFATGDGGCMIEKYIIMAYMEHMCNGKEIIPLESLDLASVDETVSEIDNDAILNGVYVRLGKLTTAIKAQNDLLTSLEKELEEERELKKTMLSSIKTTEELLRLNLVNHLMDEAEKTVEKEKRKLPIKAKGKR